MKLGRTTAGRPIASIHAASFVQVVHRFATSRFEADFVHRLLKSFAILRFVDHVGVRTDHLDAVLFEHVVPPQIHGHVQSRLPAERRQQRVGPLFLDHFGDDFPGERLDVRAIGRLRIGHDRGRVRVHQHDFVALFAEGLAGLRAGIVELARLTDDDRAGADDENLLEVVTSWHGQRFGGQRLLRACFRAAARSVQSGPR